MIALKFIIPATDLSTPPPHVVHRSSRLATRGIEVTDETACCPSKLRSGKRPRPRHHQSTHAYGNHRDPAFHHHAF